MLYRRFSLCRNIKDGCAFLWGPEDFQFRSRDSIHQLGDVAELRSHDIRISMDGQGRCLDKANMECFWWALKYEDIKIKEYVSLLQLHFVVQHYVNFYNPTQIHSALQYQTPDEVFFATCNRQAMGYSKSKSFNQSFDKKLSNWERSAV